MIRDFCYRKKKKKNNPSRNSQRERRQQGEDTQDPDRPRAEGRLGPLETEHPEAKLGESVSSRTPELET